METWSSPTVVVAGLLVGCCLALGGLFALSRMVTRARGLFWGVLLEKYPPRRDICVAVLLDVLDSFVIANLMVGGRSMGIRECPVILGERGLHLADGARIRCSIGHEINEDYIFIPWSRLSLEEASCSVEVLGTGDRLVFCSPAAALMAMRPRWKRDLGPGDPGRSFSGEPEGPHCPLPWPEMLLGSPGRVQDAAGAFDAQGLPDREALGAGAHGVPSQGRSGSQSLHGGV